MVNTHRQRICTKGVMKNGWRLIITSEEGSKSWDCALGRGQAHALCHLINHINEWRSSGLIKLALRTFGVLRHIFHSPTLSCSIPAVSVTWLAFVGTLTVYENLISLHHFSPIPPAAPAAGYIQLCHSRCDIRLHSFPIKNITAEEQRHLWTQYTDSCTLALGNIRQRNICNSCKMKPLTLSPGSPGAPGGPCKPGVPGRPWNRAHRHVHI